MFSEIGFIHLRIILGKSFLFLSHRQSLQLNLLECALSACPCIVLLFYLHSSLIVLLVLHLLIGVFTTLMIYLSLLLGLH